MGTTHLTAWRGFLRFAVACACRPEDRPQAQPPRPLLWPGRWSAAWLVQQTIAAWKDSLAGLPPKNSSWRTWMPVVLAAGPGVISTVAGSNGTEVSTEPRVAMVAQA